MCDAPASSRRWIKRILANVLFDKTGVFSTNDIVHIAFTSSVRDGYYGRVYRSTSLPWTKADREKRAYPEILVRPW